MSVLSKIAVAASIADFEVKRLFRALLGTATVTALGSTIADAVQLIARKNVVLAADDAVGVKLPHALTDMDVEIVNTVANKTLLVYPFSASEQVNAITAGDPFSLVGGARGQFYCDADGHWYVAAANLTGTATSATTAELDVLAGVTPGTGAASKAVVLDSNGAVTIPGEVSLDGNVLAVEAAAGITGGVGTVYESSVVKAGGIITTKILLDLTGLGSSTTDLDVIGQGVSAAHLGQITAARNGTILSGTVTCLEAPATGVTDIDLYAATVGTAAFDALVTDLTETALLTRGAAWAAGDIKPLTGWPAANAYLYLTGGAAGTVGTYSAGKFLIEMQGYDA